MNKINIIQTEFNGVLQEHIIIDRGNGEYTSMPKTVWDELEAQKKLGGTL